MATKLANKSVMEDYDPVMDGVDRAVATLRQSFLTLEELVMEHEDPEELRETTKMAQWVAQRDHIQMEEELKMRRTRD